MEIAKIVKDIPLEEGLYHVYFKSCFKIIEKEIHSLLNFKQCVKKKKIVLYYFKLNIVDLL